MNFVEQPFGAEGGGNKSRCSKPAGFLAGRPSGLSINYRALSADCSVSGCQRRLAHSAPSAFLSAGHTQLRAPQESEHANCVCQMGNLETSRELRGVLAT